jgi:hypothetical protein
MAPGGARTSVPQALLPWEFGGLSTLLGAADADP